MSEVYKILNGFEGLREDSFLRYIVPGVHSRKFYEEKVNKMC